MTGQSGSSNTAGWGSDLDEEPGGDQGQAAVLAVEAVVVGVEGKVVQIEEPEREREGEQLCEPWTLEPSGLESSQGTHLSQWRLLVLVWQQMASY